MSDTPETDAAIISSNGQWSFVLKETCCRLERERDQAREELEEYRSIAENIGAKKAISEKEKAIRERDEAREHLSAAKHFLNKYITERDEAREALREIWQSGDAFLPQVEKETTNRWRKAAGWKEDAK